MNKKLVIISLIVVAILIITIVFGCAIYNSDDINLDKDFEYTSSIIGKEIVEPDRIVYRNLNGQYFEFLKGDSNYDKIKNLLGNSITNYNKEGNALTDNDIDQIHNRSFIEFDYQTASKNYIIQLEENNNQAVIKLANSGGMVVSPKIENLAKIKKTLKKLEETETAHSLEYKEFISKNSLEYFEYKYQQEFKEIKYTIFQIKINNFEDYEKYETICNIAIEEKITEETFQKNDVIVTVSVLPKIDVKVNLGNIKYTYDRIENAKFQYNVHVLIVDKIVNTDCIYNTDLTEISSKVDYDNMAVNYNDSVENLSSDVFVTNYSEFITEYKNSNSKITLKEAEKIAEKGFMEAERICGEYDEDTQTSEEKNVKPNNFFTRKISEGDEVYSDNVEAYVFTRLDDMELNGVKIFVDKRLGKIVGGEAFGD